MSEKTTDVKSSVVKAEFLGWGYYKLSIITPQDDFDGTTLDIRETINLGNGYYKRNFISHLDWMSISFKAKCAKEGITFDDRVTIPHPLAVWMTIEEKLLNCFWCLQKMSEK